MSDRLNGLRFVAKAVPALDGRPRELSRIMAPHPLHYQELPYDPEYSLYNRRLTPEALNNATADEMYWKVRREVILRHTGELPIEIKGPDAERLLNRVFTRDIGKVRVGRCSYQFACYHDGGMITDGVLLRLAKDRFWMAQADGDLFSWYKAHSAGLNVEISDPDVWVSQIQGPRSLEVLRGVIDGAYPEPFQYFDFAEVTIAGQNVVVSRSGFTNELGWEIYLPPTADPQAVGDRILEVGEPLGMIITATPVFRARRIEAGLLNAGSDFDSSTTPYAAGLGGFVDLDKGDFIGREALMTADRACRTWGMRIAGGVAALGPVVEREGKIVGQVCSSGWSPYQECGVSLVRMNDPALGPGTTVTVETTDGSRLQAELCALPMYDPERLIPRGKLIDIPEQPRLTDPTSPRTMSNEIA